MSGSSRSPPLCLSHSRSRVLFRCVMYNVYPSGGAIVPEPGRESVCVFVVFFFLCVRRNSVSMHYVLQLHSVPFGCCVKIGQNI